MTNWNCPSCPKSFIRNGDLTRHKKVHTGERPHVCSECGKGFSQLSGLKTHLNTHSGAKPYVCAIGVCKSAFGDPSSCTRHRKEAHHHGPGYRCPYKNCKSRIKRRSAFTAHLRKHGIDPHSIDIDATASVPIKEKVPVKARSPSVVVHPSIQPSNNVHDIVGAWTFITDAQEFQPHSAMWSSYDDDKPWIPSINDTWTSFPYTAPQAMYYLPSSRSPSFTPPSLTNSLSPTPEPFSSVPAARSFGSYVVPQEHVAFAQRPSLFAPSPPTSMYHTYSQAPAA